MPSQLSLFAADALPPSIDDVEGLLAGPGQVVEHAGRARVSTLLDDPLRAEPLQAALATLGLETERATTEDGRTVVRTASTPALAGLAARWRSGAVKTPPAGFVLDGPRLRLWCLSAGHPDGAGYLLRVGEHDEDAWAPLGAALSAAGLAATFLGPRGGGPGYRVVGVRRLRRLCELVGDPPEGLPDHLWPAG